VASILGACVAPGGVQVPDTGPPIFASPESGAAGDTVADPSGPAEASPQEVDDLDPGPSPEVSIAYVGLPEVGVSKQGLAGVCAMDQDCAEGVCETSFPGGYCTISCEGHTDCGPGGKCYLIPQGQEKVCWKLCETSEACRLDQFCAGAVCTPKCIDGSCSAGHFCDLESGQCLPDNQATPCIPAEEACDQVDNDCDTAVDEGCGPVPGGGSSVLVEDLGKVQVGSGGLSKTLSFKLSSAAGSFAIVAVSATGASELLMVYTLTAPSGEVWLTGTDPVGSKIRAYPGAGLTTVLAPNTPLVELEPGSYSFTLYSAADLDQVWVYVLQNLRKSPTQSVLDLNLWFVGLGKLTATTAQTSGTFQDLLALFSEVMAQYDIALGVVDYLDVTGTDASKFAIVDTPSDGSYDEGAELMALSKSLPSSNRGINLFFVQGFNGWSLLGKAGHIPGPPLVHGTYASGVLVSLTEYFDYGYNGGIQVTAETMAHEIGHQLGLFHTSEHDGDSHDPIPDTPECTYDKNGDGAVNSDECDGKGAENLMFWVADLTTYLTPGQKSVIHANPSLYPP
jgi:hypothetical protein